MLDLIKRMFFARGSATWH